MEEELNENRSNKCFSAKANSSLEYQAGDARNGSEETATAFTLYCKPN